LDADLAAVAGRRWWNRWTIVLGLALLLAGGFVAGIEVQKAYGETSTTATPGGGQGGFAFPGGYPGGAAQGGAQGGGATQRQQATTGTIKLVDGNTVYVETESGEVVTIRTDGDTSVRVPGKLKDLKAGDKVSVEGGAAGADGSVTASSVTKTE
jgi:hypothetical protein